MFNDARWRPTISTGSRCESSTKLSTVPIKNYDFKLKAITDEKASSSSRGRVSYKELVRFGLPTLGIWLLQPILSLIDTAVIGMNPTTTVAELAALGPGIAWVDSSAYLCYFLSVATTNLFANALRENDVSQARTVLANAISFASVLGVILGVVQYGLAGQSISLLSGSSRLSVPYGVTYARIRALAAPAALLTMVAQSAFLASKDSTTPLKAVLIGACVNVIGDVALVRGLKLGVAGAAWATAGSQVAGILYLIYAAVSQRVKSHNTTTTSSLSTTTTLTSTSTTPKKSLLSRARRWLSIVREDIRQPKWSEAKQFLAFCGPLFVVLLIKSFLWTFTTYATSTASDGAVHLAAHQIIINFFVMFCIFGDVVAQIAATYLPYTLHYPHTTPSISTSNSTSNNTTTSPSTSSTSLLPQWSRESRGLISQITVMGSVLGSVNSVFGYLLASFGAKFLTRSTAVIHCMNRVAPLLALSALPHCLMLGYEGVIIAGRDVTFLSFNYVIMALFFLAYQSYVRWRGVGIVGVWVGMVLLQWSRLFVFFLRQRKIVGENMLRAESGERQGGD